MAQKFPNIAGTSISYLRDFLVDPSPILAKLHSQAVTQQQKDKESPPLKILGNFEITFVRLKFMVNLTVFSTRKRFAFC